jgi:hypothetical protein
MDKSNRNQLQALSSDELVQVWGGIKRQTLIDAIDRLDSAGRAVRARHRVEPSARSLPRTEPIVWTRPRGR